MLVLVTGATGFLGRRVVPELQAHRHEVRCLVHTPGRERVFPPRSVDVHYGNVLDPGAVAAAFYDVEAVVHLVGAIRQRKGRSYDQINRQGVVNVLAAAKDAGVKHFIYVSVIGANSNPSYPYLHSKWRGEQAVVSSGLPYTILQPSILFGQGDEFLNAIAGLVRLFPLVPVVGSGRNRLQPAAAEDVARCIALTVGRESLKGKTIELGGPQQLSYNEIVAIVARTLGKRRLRLHIPVWMMFPATALMQRLLARPPVTTDQLRMLAIRSVADVGIVEGTFGFTPQPLEGNIDYVRSVGIRDGLNIITGLMPSHIRDH
ncbi:MAG: complex I NDUFA9 subunit family protein [Dehalococcoidia bacterium]|nr:complex I NDUFA9 subunit family protein [Dehalococcoidia bacterium]